MTEEQIIEIAHKYLYHYDTELCQWEINEENIEDVFKFARAMYDEGYDNGYDEGYVQCSFDMGDENV